MKKLLTTVIIICTVLSVTAQEQDKIRKTKNEIGFELSDLINGAFQIKYERLLGEHISVSLGLGYKGDNGLISLSGIDTDKIKTGDLTYSGLKVIPEVRYYLNNNGHYGKVGFYFGAYLKYSNYQSDLNGTYTNDASETFTIEFDADIKVTSIGLMVGYKLPISKRFSIDFLIAGPGSGSYDFSFVNKQDLPDEFYDDFNDALENYSLFDLLDGEFRFESTNKNSKFNILSFRYGVSIGFSF